MKKKPLRREKSSSPDSARDASSGQFEVASELRVIGGTWRGRKIAYSGDPRTRPMKDSTREAIFNLLTDRIKGFCAVDLFAGTGALGIEALSRGAARGVFCERHFPSADLIRSNLVELGAADRAEVLPCDTFLQIRKMQRDGLSFDAERPWVVFCSPPYALYTERQTDMLSLIDDAISLAPIGSWFVVEADGTFDLALLPYAKSWRVRPYHPAVVGIYVKEGLRGEVLGLSEDDSPDA